MYISKSYRVAVELLWRDFVRQRLAGLIGDRAAGYVPTDAEAWPAPEDRRTRFLPATLPAPALAALRCRCRMRGVTFHALLSAALVTAYSQERAVRHPPAPFTTDRVVRGGVLLGLVAVVATLASATGSSKAVNYLSSFLGIYAGVMCVHALTELPPGFAHVTSESELLLAAGPPLDPPPGPSTSGTAVAAPRPPLPRLRRRCAGRVSTAVDASSDLWAVAGAYHASLRRRWVDTGAGFLLAERCAALRLAATSRRSPSAVHAATAGRSSGWLAAARALLRLDDPHRRGGRTLGLACRQLPLPPREPAPSGGGSGAAWLPHPWVTAPTLAADQAVGPPQPAAQHGGLDESGVGAGFALYYSTGPLPEDHAAHASSARPLSLTLAFAAPTEAAAAAAQCASKGGPANPGTRNHGNSSRRNSRSSSRSHSAAPAVAEEAHAAAVLARVVTCLEREAAAEEANEAAMAAADPEAKKRN